MHWIRFVLTEDQANRQKLGSTSGIYEVDETFVGKPRPGDPRTVLPGYSKKLENLEHNVALHFMNYNFCRIHHTLRVMPSMKAVARLGFVGSCRAD